MWGCAIIPSAVTEETYVKLTSSDLTVHVFLLTVGIIGINEQAVIMFGYSMEFAFSAQLKCA